MAVESFIENNITAAIATAAVPVERRGSQHYWLGLASLDDLRTNTLESAAGTLVSQYSGKSSYLQNRRRRDTFAAISPTSIQDNLTYGLVRKRQIC